MLLPEQNNMYENHPTLYNVYTYTIPMLGRGFLIRFGKHAKKKEKIKKIYILHKVDDIPSRVVTDNK